MLNNKNAVTAYPASVFGSAGIGAGMGAHLTQSQPQFQ